jgi:hypothetical protein
MTPADLRQHVTDLSDKPELAAFLADIADAMESPMELFTLDALPRKSGLGVIRLRGPPDNVIAIARRGTMLRQVGIFVVEAEPAEPAEPRQLGFFE